MQPQLQRLEVQPAVGGDDDLAVDHTPIGQLRDGGATSSGKYRVIGRSLRLPSSTSSPSRKQIDRKPSHFGSYEASGGIVATDLDSIGETGGMTGSCIDSLSRPPDDIARGRRST